MTTNFSSLIKSDILIPSKSFTMKAKSKKKNFLDDGSKSDLKKQKTLTNSIEPLNSKNLSSKQLIVDRAFMEDSFRSDPSSERADQF